MNNARRRLRDDDYWRAHRHQPWLVLGGFLLLISVLAAITGQDEETLAGTGGRTAAGATGGSTEPALSRAGIAPELSSPVSAETTGADLPGTVTGQRRVSQIIDGDTIVLAAGDRVRVLGIDSCESGTSGGLAATIAARDALRGKTVTLRAEPGVDRDRHDRLLRYVEAPGVGDFGRYMVSHGTHTGVYDGRNDAASTYLASLRALGAERSCGAELSTRQQPAARAPAPVDAPAPAPPRTASPPAAPAPARAPAGEAFKNCAAARAAGAAPVHRGQPGYGPHLDRDNDGIGCEWS
ncbi:excalibur calcium-binding domain-containing protein [Pseudonocardia autotrophica]|uniref:SPBc2 prophage-derived endonuclease YokF n=2 Tax=Pseudonocardia TaxID=1847 RepID=A0A1Y2N924_PSEAH|nr:excalibur calcium-binding domain-containing protein [Pseudonocardia autotrophica]OSY43972.1 SPBc2 prophage-derived endonuclease YokF precursor [Pseudonocardia autotrophica]TDN74295.1 excalibur calcium-binding domain-containing protein [Pseudonocardia autotrophica]BBG05059.1 hypothetical protein Pdca_62680 [Pseudonocardia autotrophica]GEC27952.1 hypothetical protein PSA01_49810 [Pseudonocardia saturnea]